MILNKFLKKIIKFFRNNGPEADDDFSLSLYELFNWSLIRGIQLLRGLCYVFRYKTLFLGHKVKLQFRRNLKIGKSCIIGDYVLINAFSVNGIDIGAETTIERGTIIQGSGVIRNKGVGVIIGNNCSVGAFGFIGGQGGVAIGNDTIIGAGIKIFSENHNYLDTKLIRKQGETRSAVKVGNNCWLGANVTILAGAEVGDNCVVAASALVNKKFPSNVIIAGIPARVIKEIIHEDFKDETTPNGLLYS